MQLAYDKAMETLGAFGLQPIEAEGGLFDPDQHAALMQEPSDKHPPKTVLRELQKGYRLKGRTIRASSVVISQAPQAQQADEPAEEQPEEQ
jgi:molecular chaperone GrpE